MMVQSILQQKDFINGRDNMRFFYDKDKSMELMQKIEKEFGARSRKTARGKEMHVSDLTGCQLRAYNRITGVPRHQTKQQIGVMVFGIIAETVVGWTYPKDELQYQSNLWLLQGDSNIFGHIDIYEDKKSPLEIKASRKSIFRAKEIPIYWVEQLMTYMAMQSATKGWLILFNVFSTQIMAFQMKLTTEDILDWLILINERAIKIRNAADNNDPSDLEINPLQYSWCDYKGTCPRANECKNRWKIIDSEKKKSKKSKR